MTDNPRLTDEEIEALVKEWLNYYPDHVMDKALKAITQLRADLSACEAENERFRVLLNLS